MIINIEEVGFHNFKSHGGHARPQKCRGDRILGQWACASKFKMAAKLTLEAVLEEVTGSDSESLEDLRDSCSDEEEDQKTKAIDSAVDVFTDCSDLGENIAHFKLCVSHPSTPELF